MNQSSSSIRSARALPALTTLTLAMGCVGPAWAIDGGTIAAGTGTIQTRRNVTTVNQSSDRMIVNWRNFDLARDQSVNFRQPGATSAVLNRVGGSGKATEILGSINANGRVFVVNPDGVMFGRTAKVNVGALVASSLDAKDASFMQDDTAGGYLQMRHGGGGVRNEGTINASDTAVLLGGKVENPGTVRARNVRLAAMNGAAIRLGDSSFDILPTVVAKDGSVLNSGTLSARGGNVDISAAVAGDLIGGAIRNTGLIEATRAVTGEGGSIVLGSDFAGAIRIGGKLRADNGIQAHTDLPVCIPEMPQELMLDTLGHDRAASGHDVRVEPGARVQAGGGVRFRALDGDVITAGTVYGSGVLLESSRNVTISAPIRATSGGVRVHAFGNDGAVTQNAGITATSDVSLSGRHVFQNNAVRTKARSVTIDARGHDSDGSARLANIDAETIRVDTSERLELNGDLTANGDIRISLHNKFTCPAGTTCASPVRPGGYGGTVVQNGNIISRSGDVTVFGATDLSFDGEPAVSVAPSGVFNQSVGTKTRAGGNVEITMGSVEVGNIQAGKRIDIDALAARLNGRLAAPEVVVPANTQNQEGNIRITL